MSGDDKQLVIWCWCDELTSSWKDWGTNGGVIDASPQGFYTNS